MGSSNGKPVLREDDVEAIMKTSGMSEQQVRRDFDIFVTQYPTGVLTCDWGYRHCVKACVRCHEADRVQADGVQDAAHQRRGEDGAARAQADMQAMFEKVAQCTMYNPRRRRIQ